MQTINFYNMNFYIIYNIKYYNQEISFYLFCITKNVNTTNNLPHYQQLQSPLLFPSQMQSDLVIGLNESIVL